MTPDAKAEPYPLEYWALRDVMSNVEVSPDGNYLGLLKIPKRDANPVLEVYDASNLDAEPFRIDGGRMEITGFDWVGNQDMVVRFRQKVRDKIDDFNQGVYEYQIALLDVKEEKIEKFREANPAIENLLPNKPNKIIISMNPGMEDRGDRLQRTFRPRAYYELDLESGNKKLLLQGKLSMGQVGFDGEGNPWYARGFDRGSDEYLWYVREPDSDDWEVIHRQHEDSFETFTPQGMDPEKPDILLVVAHNGRDKTALWEFNIKTKKFGEIVYARNDVNVGGTRYHSNFWTNPDTIVGVTYRTDKLHVEYLDPVEGATYAQLDSVIPEAYQVYITSRARDGQTLTIYNFGPKDPGTYYLLKDGALKTIGSKQPLLKSEDLAEVRYVHWKARDGMDLHGYLTMPTKGEAPFPLIVLPHGGPFVSETVVYDEWSQMLANNGYLVLQPQYRGSTNFGLEYYQSAFLNGGQGGYKMQDDKDDGAMYLVEEGLADKDRIAMFGWSYGGYAALVAASRTPQIHQCVIAGAAVSDTLMQVAYYSDRMRGAQEVEQLNMWRDSINPIKEADKVNVPILLVHGDVDQRVPPAHVRKYLDELEKYNKPHKYLELEGADHFSNTLFYEHQIELYEAMIDYLKNDCGPGGL
ncbi:MAG: prolyl oligopeptidase family serine peptidase [Gammaproteobacteria bacterium]|nr:prolyl oligopeptidase family serine peptidase [Gammaproteobacteria bacterium]